MAEIRINATGALKLYDSDDSNYVALQSAGTVSSNITWTLPSADGSSGQMLSTNGSGTLSWATASSADPSSADGDTLGTASAEWSDLYLADGGVIYFGNDQEITLTHNADDGLLLKHVGTGDGKEPSLTFQAGDNDIAQDDVLGSIFFQAPDEGAGTDAVLVAAGIEAVSEGDFSSSNNATKLSFKTAASEAAAEKMSLSSAGLLTVTGGVTMTGTTPTLTIGDAGAEDTKIVFDGNAQDFHIGLDDSADDLVIGLGSTLGTTSHIVIDEAGHVTKPLQPCFHIFADADTNYANDAVLFTSNITEIYDLNADMSTGGIFTAPVTGKYHFEASAMFSDLEDGEYAFFRLVASNRELQLHMRQKYEEGATGYSNYWKIIGSCIVDMDASDTAKIVCSVDSTHTLTGSGSGVDSWFAGYLIC